MTTEFITQEEREQIRHCSQQTMCSPDCKYFNAIKNCIKVSLDPFATSHYDINKIAIINLLQALKYTEKERDEAREERDEAIEKLDVARAEKLWLAVELTDSDCPQSPCPHITEDDSCINCEGETKVQRWLDEAAAQVKLYADGELVNPRQYLVVGWDAPMAAEQPEGGKE